MCPNPSSPYIGNPSRGSIEIWFVLNPLGASEPLNQTALTACRGSCRSYTVPLTCEEGENTHMRARARHTGQGKGPGRLEPTHPVRSAFACGATSVQRAALQPSDIQPPTQAPPKPLSSKWVLMLFGTPSMRVALPSGLCMYGLWIYGW